MRKICTYHFAIRIASLSCVLLMVTADLLFPRGTDRDMFCFGADALSGISLLFFSPLNHETNKLSLRFALLSGSVLLLFMCLSRILGMDELAGIVFQLGMSQLIVMIYLAFRCRERYSCVRQLFRNTAVWTNVEEYARLFYLAMFSGLCFLCTSLVSLESGRVGAIVTSALILTLSVLIYLRSYLSKTLFLGDKIERQARSIINGNLRTVPLGFPEDDAGMGKLYQRILAAMEKAPYLDPDFDLADLSREVYVNKSYVSRTINLFSGRNFRQFVNYHRIRYAMDLMEKDRHLKVMEVAMMSGFHSVVSFNMAFKINNQETPTEFMRRLRV